MDFNAFYVLVSRVCSFDSLRVLHYSPSAHAQLLELHHEADLAVWDAGYDAAGRWSDERARAAKDGAYKRHHEAKAAAGALRTERKAAYDPPSLELLKGVLVQRCKDAGLDESGTKPVLVERLLAAGWQPPHQQALPCAPRKAAAKPPPAGASKKPAASSAAKQPRKAGAPATKRQASGQPSAPGSKRPALFPAWTLTQWKKLGRDELKTRCNAAQLQIGVVDAMAQRLFAHAQQQQQAAAAAALPKQDPPQQPQRGTRNGGKGPAAEAGPPREPQRQRHTKPANEDLEREQPQPQQQPGNAARIRREGVATLEGMGLRCPFGLGGSQTEAIRRELLRGFEPPTWLQEAQSRLVLRARIVDYWTGNATQNLALQRWLALLGFSGGDDPLPLIDNRAHQIGLSCGPVAVQALALILRAVRAGDAWLTADCTGATNPAVTRFAYAEHQYVYSFSTAAEERAAQKRKRDEKLPNTPPAARSERSVFMGDREKIAATLDEQLHTLDRHAIPTTHTQQVYCLARAVFEREFGEDAAIRQAQRLAVSPFDTFCLQIVHELQAASALVADGKGADVDGGVRMAIPNSSCTGGGMHWFAIAYTIEPAATTHDAGTARGS